MASPSSTPRSSAALIVCQCPPHPSPRSGRGDPRRSSPEQVLSHHLGGERFAGRASSHCTYPFCSSPPKRSLVASLHPKMGVGINDHAHPLSVEGVEEQLERVSLPGYFKGLLSPINRDDVRNDRPEVQLREAMRLKTLSQSSACAPVAPLDRLHCRTRRWVPSIGMAAVDPHQDQLAPLLSISNQRRRPTRRRWPRKPRQPPFLLSGLGLLNQAPPITDEDLIRPKLRRHLQTVTIRFLPNHHREPSTQGPAHLENEQPDGPGTKDHDAIARIQVRPFHGPEGHRRRSAMAAASRPTPAARGEGIPRGQWTYSATAPFLSRPIRPWRTRSSQRIPLPCLQ